ncbi:MAG: hypothetical protein IPG96_11580 [Proteobacteria bacterium]|nr:hypothetical protein [Pseudomonadota bacterium]
MHRHLPPFSRTQRALALRLSVTLLLAAPAGAGAQEQVQDPNAGFSDDYSDVIGNETLPPEQPLDDGTPVTDDYPAQPAYAPAPAGEATTYLPASTLPPELATHYQTLAPYGRWLQTPDLGPVWVPHRAVVGEGFVPYVTGGEWEPTDQGSMFVARAWSWGWLPFHYGRWFRHRALGWAWRPGSVWAPAWVRWRVGGGYVGWAPTPPEARYFANDAWFFAPEDSWLGPRVYERMVPRQRWSVAFGVTRPHTRIISYRDGGWNARWYAGPELGARWSGRYRPIAVRPPRPYALAEVRVGPFGSRASGTRVVYERPVRAEVRVIAPSVRVYRHPGARTVIRSGAQFDRADEGIDRPHDRVQVMPRGEGPRRIVIRRGAAPGQRWGAPPSTSDDEDLRSIGRERDEGDSPTPRRPDRDTNDAPRGGGHVRIRYR